MAANLELNYAIMQLYDDNVLDVEDVLLLQEAQRPGRNLHMEQPYWQYPAFDLERMEEHECEVEFRFTRREIYTLVETFGIPEEIRCYNGTVINSIEALCITLKRFTYPCRYVDLIPRFARPVPHLCMASNLITDTIFDRFQHLLTNINQPWLSPPNLKLFADAIHYQGAALNKCWGFVDGTVRPICRPGQHQREVYNGHKRVHAPKFQSVVTPNGLIANMYGPVEGRRHDSAILMMSELLPQLEQFSFSPTGQALCIYGDPAYPHRIHLQRPYERRAPLTEEQQAFNQSMSQVRVAVEWVFGDIVNYFKVIDFKRNLKIGLSSIGKMYSVCALLQNALTCLHGSNTGDFFNVEPPELSDYFI